MAEREHVLSTQCYCRPVVDTYGSNRQTKLPCPTGEHRYHWSSVQVAACQAVAERMRENEDAS